MKRALVSVVLGSAILAFAGDGDKVPLAGLAERAVAQSKLTLPGSKPFHLKVEIVETTNPSSEYQGKVEEYWLSPEKWRRTIDAPGFSETLIVNGDQVYEKDTGDYFPWWLNDLVTAMVDPLPMLDLFKQANAEIAKPKGSEKSTSCAYISTNIDRWGICFGGSRGLLTSVFARGYDAEFRDFMDFGGKRVARSVLIDPEPGTHIQARITELTELRDPEESLFAVAQATPAQQRIKSIQVDEATVRALAAGSTEVAWPAVGGGPLTGRCAVYISVDRMGHVRESWPHGCDNAGLQDPLREIVQKWQLKPAADNGSPVQIEALVTFPFETKLVGAQATKQSAAAAKPTEGAANKTGWKGPAVVPPRIVKTMKPDCGEGQSCHGIHGEVVVAVMVQVDGTAGEITVESGDPRLFDAAKSAAKQCTFEPGTFMGTPTSMSFDVVYQF